VNGFPEDFSWGVATSSYQIEGAAHLDGRGVSIWDTFSRTPGKVVNAENGDVACDHYHRYPEDVEIMKQLGVNAYRFSLAWPRMFPNGDSQREERGFAFYDRLIDSLLEANIKPMATAYHWDLPQTLEDKGGWANRDTALRFADYAAAAVERFGDRITNWLTINEPWCVSWLGYMSGVHAPGVRDLDAALAAAHNTALAHGYASRGMKAVNPSIRTGIAVNMTNYRISEDASTEVRELADLMDAQLNRWWIDAYTNGQYPQVLVDYHGERLARLIQPGDADVLKVETDFLGINYYSDSFLTEPDENSHPAMKYGPFPFHQREKGNPPGPLTDMGWPVTPEGLKDLLVRVHTDWPDTKDISITENGAAYDEQPDVDGVVNDERRVAYLEAHIDNVRKAAEAGAPVKSYFAWSLLDNFEWAEGYAKRFGIVHVDFDTLERTPKNSALAYREIIAKNSVSQSVGVY
jgi:beta-glucosidase